MLVSPDAIFGTIGGGQLEFMAIDRAREMLGGAPARSEPSTSRSVPKSANAAAAGSRWRSRWSTRQARGAAEDGQGRGRQAAACADLRRRPCRPCAGGGICAVAGAADRGRDARRMRWTALPRSVETRLTPVPEEMVRDAPAGSAFVVLTHDHALDFLIVAEALKRADAAYVGMIGSKTKKATFRSWYLKTAGGTEDGLRAARLADRRRRRQGQAPRRHRRAGGGGDHDGAGRRVASARAIPFPGCAPRGTTATCRARANRR